MPAFQGLQFTANVQIVSQTSDDARDTLALGTVVVTTAAQRWRMRVEFEPTVPALGGAVAGQLIAHELEHGIVTAFDIPMPQTVGAGTGIRAATGSAGADRISISGAALPAGLFVTFAGDTKVYMLTDDSGGITPPLRQAVAGAAVNVTPNLRARYAPDGDSGFGTDRRGTMRIIRTFVEAV